MMINRKISYLLLIIIIVAITVIAYHTRSIEAFEQFIRIKQPFNSISFTWGFWFAILFVLLLISEASNEFRRMRMERKLPLLQNKPRNMVYRLSLTLIISIISFALFSHYEKEILNSIDREVKVISDYVTLFIPEFKITWSDVIKISIMTLIVYVAFSAYFKMRKGRDKAKIAFELLKEDEFIRSTRLFKLSCKEDLIKLKKYSERLRIEEKNKEGFEKENVTLLISTIDNLINTKSKSSAKSESNYVLSRLEHEINKCFSESNVAQATLPLLGFAGTIIGIMIAMGNMDLDPKAIKGTIKTLAVAFDTTLIAVLCAYFVRTRERKLLEETQEYLHKREDKLKTGFYDKFSS